MKLFRFLAYSFAFFLGAVFAFRGTNTFPAPPPKQYQPPVRTVALIDKSSEASVFQDKAVAVGKTLFYNNCAACHNKNMKDNLTGPALGGVLERWAEYPVEDLYEWIRNSQALIETGHPHAQALWMQFGPTVMTSFPNLSDEEINQILTYTKVVYHSF